MKRCLFGLAILAASTHADEFTITADVPYVTPPADVHQAERCKLDISSPTGARDLPVLVFFHGGGLTGGAKHFPEMDRAGLVVVTAGYRLLKPEVAWPAPAEDAAAAVAWVFKNIQGFGGDPKRIFVSGHSAGGYLCAIVGMDARWLKPHGKSNLDLAGIIPVSAQVTTHFAVKKTLGDTGEQYRPLITPEAPLYHCAAKLPPVCLITGDRKIEFPCRVEENELMAISLRTLKHPRTEFHELPGKDHSTVAPAAAPFVRQFIATVTQPR
ncbi:MAG: alpha/beta hydrolase [Kiritimatiellaeota bacterium]|nr:alpha/beta hydrolase [Kiritimatiellota bacterium]